MNVAAKILFYKTLFIVLSRIIGMLPGIYFISLYLFLYRNLCPNGTYSLGAQIKCTICLPGSKCPSITEGPTICPSGYFSERNAADCKLCEAGKQCADPACKGINVMLWCVKIVI